MSSRNEYQREYQRRRRAADPERAREEGRLAYGRRKAREAADPALRRRRERLAREWTHGNRERVALNARRLYGLIRANPEGLSTLRRQTRDAQAIYRAKWEHQVKLRARWAVWRAIRSGKLKRRPCEVCGVLRAHAHHDDYLKPLKVRWLCRQHHEDAHHRQAAGGSRVGQVA